jgi:hypothetical protein
MRQALAIVGLLMSGTAVSTPASAQAWVSWNDGWYGGPGFSVGVGSAPYYGNRGYYAAAPAPGGCTCGTAPSAGYYSNTFVREPTYSYQSQSYSYDPNHNYSYEPGYSYRSYSYEPSYTYGSGYYGYRDQPNYRDHSRVVVRGEFRRGVRAPDAVRYGRSETTRTFRNDRRGSEEFATRTDNRRNASFTEGRSQSSYGDEFRSSETPGRGQRMSARVQAGREFRDNGGTRNGGRHANARRAETR